MLRTKAIKKIFMTTLSMFIILTVFSLSTVGNSNILRTNLEIEDISGIVTDNIYFQLSQIFSKGMCKSCCRIFIWFV